MPRSAHRKRVYRSTGRRLALFRLEAPDAIPRGGVAELHQRRKITLATVLASERPRQARSPGARPSSFAEPTMHGCPHGVASDPMVQPSHGIPASLSPDARPCIAGTLRPSKNALRLRSSKIILCGAGAALP